MKSGARKELQDQAGPPIRAERIVKRKEEAARTGDPNMSQVHFARKGMITEEMGYVAYKEKLPRTRPLRGGQRDDDHPGQHQSPRA